MTNPYRALCANLTAALNDWQCETGDDRYEGLLDHARALLAEAVAEGPTDEELEEEFGAALLKLSGDSMNATAVDYARAVLDRWGRPTPQPVAVSERWPDFSDCDPQERVWAWNPALDHWKLSRINRSVHTHWLPANALPTPEATND